MTLRKLCSGFAFLGILLLALTPAGAGIDRWTPFGPSDAPIISFAVDPSAANSLVAGLFPGGVMRSTDGGTSWRAAGLDEEIVTDLASSSSSVYAITASGKVFASAPGGPAWRTLYNGDAFDSASADDFAAARLAIGPRHLYLGLGGTGLFRSADGGRSWRKVLGGTVASVAVDPRTGEVYAGLLGGRILVKSSNAGGRWTTVAPQLTGFPLGVPTLAIAPTPTSPSTIFAGTSYPGLYRSTDGGATWRKLKLQSPTTDYLVTGLAVDPADPRTVYVATTYATWVSHDGGETWNGEDRSPFFAVRALAVDSHSGLLYGASIDTVGRSSHEGEDWRAVYFQPEAYGAGAAGVAVDPANPATAYLLGDGPLRSTDAGRTWSSIPAPGPGAPFFSSVRDVLFDPADPALQYLASAAGLFRSVDHGESWNLLPLAVGPVETLARLGARTILLGGCGIDLSTDGGETSRNVFSCEVPGADDESGRFPKDFLVDPQNPRTVYAEVSEYVGHRPTFYSNLYRSLDGGRSWQPMLANSQVLALDPARPRTLYAVRSYDKKVLKSLDRGRTWSVVGELPDYALDLLADRKEGGPAVLYAATQNRGVLRSTDGGATWSALNAGLGRRANETAYHLDLHPTLPHHLYVVVTGKVFGAKFE